MPLCNEIQAIKVLNMIKLFGKAIRVNKASQDKDTLDVGANLFIGNLDPDVDEKVCDHIIENTLMRAWWCIMLCIVDCPSMLVHLRRG